MGVKPAELTKTDISPTSNEAPVDKAQPIIPDLPRFPIDVGYRTVRNPDTGKFEDIPLTLLEFLYPTEEDVGAVKVTQSPLHDIWTTLITVMLKSYLEARNWLVVSDVLIHWAQPRAPRKSPGVAAILQGTLPDERDKSIRVGRDGPTPAFIIEITSEETREGDFHEKKQLYAAVGVKEYLLIDILSDRSGPWRLYGFRLEDSPTYNPLIPDEDGGLTFETIGIRFVGIGRERIDLYEVSSGERLLTLDEMKAKAEAEASRADTEAVARQDAEYRATQLERELRELRARYGESDEEV